MRAALLSFVLLCFSRIGGARDFPRVNGLVVDDMTGTPVAKAVVLLDSGYSPEGRRYGAVTDTSGQFSVPEIRPAKYTITLERAGYVSLAGVLALDIDGGQPSIGITLKLTRQGIIGGKITNPAALPRLYELKLWKTTFTSPDHDVEPLTPVSIAEDGSFMIGNLSPGRYLLEKPGLSLANAVVLDLTAGKEIRGIQVRQQARAQNRISGVARNPVPGSRMDAGVHLEGKDPSGSWVSLRNFVQVDRLTGAFTFRSIPPGDYRITAISVLAGRLPRKYWTRQEVHVEGRSTPAISLDFAPMAVVTGTISEEPGLPARSQPLYVSLGRDDLYNWESARVNQKGTFRLQVVPGLYRLFAGNGSENVRLVKSIRLNRREAKADGMLDISAEGGILEILLSGPGREIQGMIRDGARRSVAGATVAVWTDEGAIGTTLADALGYFTIRNVPRGLIYIAACEPAAEYPWQHASFRASFQKLAVKVPAKSPFRVTVELRAIPRTAAEAELAKLR
jgi:hypothetical protein